MLKRILKWFGFFPEPLTFEGIYSNPRTGELYIYVRRVQPAEADVRDP
jgi:hypothetical protein